MTIDRVIGWASAIGLVWICSTSGIWGPVVDNLECKSTPTMQRKEVRL